VITTTDLGPKGCRGMDEKHSWLQHRSSLVRLLWARFEIRDSLNFSLGGTRSAACAGECPPGQVNCVLPKEVSVWSERQLLPSNDFYQERQ
jgi:hypothetical protein